MRCLRDFGARRRGARFHRQFAATLVAEALSRSFNNMRIHVASDLHTEFLAHTFPGESGLKVVGDADILVLAGDIAKGAAGLSLFKDWPMPVVYVCGNHELYSHEYEKVFEELDTRSRGTSVRFLEREVLDYGGVRILGCTLWTDYLLDGESARPEAMSNAQRGLNDHRLIRMQRGGVFTPEDALYDHEKSRAWLERELGRAYDGKTVVVTHHGPHPSSIHAQYIGNNLNAAFVSDLSPLLTLADFWLHGHVHNSFDYQVGSCRVVSNPRGYPLNRNSVATMAELRYENPTFAPRYVVDTSAPAWPTTTGGASDWWKQVG
jgi:predicted phosphodiesterase